MKNGFCSSEAQLAPHANPCRHLGFPCCLADTKYCRNTFRHNS